MANIMQTLATLIPATQKSSSDSLTSLNLHEISKGIEEIIVVLSQETLQNKMQFVGNIPYKIVSHLLNTINVRYYFENQLSH